MSAAFVGINGGFVDDWASQVFWGAISNSHCTGMVRGGVRVGGLVGENIEAIITASYSTGEVTGDQTVGGLAGYNNFLGRVISSYSTGPVSGQARVGGLVGQNDEGCLYTWAMDPIVCGEITDSYWDIETSGEPNMCGFQGPDATGCDNSCGKTTAELQTASTFLEAGWDFIDETANGTEDIWKIVEGQTYPLLSWQKYGGGTGEPNDPYLIYTPEHLNALGAEPNDYDKHFKLMADIDLSGYSYDRAVIAPDTNDATSWHDGALFTGTFDGNGHTVSHLTISGERYLGLFGQLGDYWDIDGTVEVKSLGIVDVNIVGSGGRIGGLAGLNYGPIAKCYVTGNISGQEFVGGLAGYNGENGKITQSYAMCVINTESSPGGGLVGKNAGFEWSGEVQVAVISDCYCIVMAGSRVSGLAVGQNGRTHPMMSRCPGVVVNCYATCGDGEVELASGQSYLWDGEFLNCFWNAEACPIADEGVGGTGRTTAEMQSAATFLDAGWDFVGETLNGTEHIWAICEGGDYPHLAWEFVIGDFDADSDTDFADFCILAERWLGADGSFWCGQGCDLTNDGSVNWQDLMVFAENWSR